METTEPQPLAVYKSINAVQSAMQKEVISKGRIRKVVGFETYYATEDGRVFSERLNDFLKAAIDSRGYYHITLNENGRRWQGDLHTVIATSFLGVRPVGLVMNHKDGNPLNNDVSNLEWVTQSENVLHAYRMGLRVINGEHRARCAKLGLSRRKISHETIISIRESYRGTRGELAKLGRKFNIGHKEVRAILIGKIYKTI